MMMRQISFVVLICLFVGVTKINGNDIKGRLLTPEEGCGFTKVKNNRIVGGSEAKVGAWPWMALLCYKQENLIRINCGGSLITSRHVLTAAHCLNPTLQYVRLGEHDVKTTNDGQHQDIQIARSVPHKYHDKIFHVNDIAILHLKVDVEFSDRIRPICLPLDDPLRSRNFDDTNPFVAGFGFTASDGHPPSVLMQVQVPVIPTKDCREKVKKIGALFAFIQIQEHIICAGGQGGKGIFSGDSGGPLMLPVHKKTASNSNNTFPFYQIGICAFIYRVAEENVPDMYSSVQYHADWIKEQIENSTDNVQAEK